MLLVKKTSAWEGVEGVHSAVGGGVVGIQGLRVTVVVDSFERTIGFRQKISQQSM